MDGQRFDEITRALAIGTSRRRVMRGVGAAAVATLLGRAGVARAQSAQTASEKEAEKASKYLAKCQENLDKCGSKETYLKCTECTAEVEAECSGLLGLDLAASTCLCPGEDACFDVCCDPDRPETETCCPGAGACCECFDSSDPGNEGLFCCEADKICGTYPDDQCCHYDEGCFNDDCIWEERLCEGGVCPNKCCGGECCGPWDTCGVDQNGNEFCQPLPTCTLDNEATVCAGIGPCVVVDSGVSVCCSSERLIDFSNYGAPEGTYSCCPFGEQPTQNGEPITCCPGPNFCGTSRGMAVRA